MIFSFTCRAGHTFEAEGEYRQFDQARKCAHAGCSEPAFMLVKEMAAASFSTAEADRAAYFQHNKTYTRQLAPGQEGVGFAPNEHAAQCQCQQCRGHRRRAYRTETAEPLRRNKRVAKEVRL